MLAFEKLRVAFWRERSAEERLLFCCARQDFDEVWQARACDIIEAEPIDWDKVLAISVLHQVAPLIYRNLQAKAELVRRVPGATLLRFRQALLLNIDNKKALATALRDSLAWFESLGVDVLLVKGTSLDVVLYEEAWFTVSQDLDLVLDADWDSFDGATQKRILEMNVARPLIDVHCHRHADLVMNGLLPLDFGRIIATARRCQVQGHPALLMRTEDELLCACIQSFRKRYFRLKSIVEVAELIERFGEGANHPLDWDAFLDRAVQEGCGGIVYAALVAAHVTHGCVLPEHLHERLRVGAVSKLLVHSLTRRLSCTSLEALYVDRFVRGKMLGRGLLLPYASIGLRKLGRSLRIVSSQLRRGGASDRRDDDASNGEKSGDHR